MDEQALREACSALPVFPLPRTVLMPGAVLPLHVFEPRYRELVSHCLESGGLMAIATLEPGYEADYEGTPALHAELGVGEIVGHQPLPDGRCNIVLQYVGGARMIEELATDHPFRMVRAEPAIPDGQGHGASLQRLKLLVLQLGAAAPGAADEAGRLVQLDGDDMVDSLARKLFQDPDDQRRYLGAARLADRVGMVEDRLATFLMAAPSPRVDA